MGSRQFRVVGLVGRGGDQRAAVLLEQLAAFLQRRGLEMIVANGAADRAVLPPASSASADITEVVRKADLMIVVGGDGSLLGVARATAGRDLPILGVNCGRLGFLVDIMPERVEEQVDQILAGNYQEESHFLLSARVLREGAVIHENHAVNEVALRCGVGNRIADLHLRINGEQVCALRADGLIISTPTGSTAHALSAGGPILHPSIDALAIVPICPHGLANRPLVVEGSSKVCVEVAASAAGPLAVSYDGQEEVAVSVGDQVEIHKAGSALLLRKRDYGFYEVCRRKLNWASYPGEDGLYRPVAHGEAEGGGTRVGVDNKPGSVG